VRVAFAFTLVAAALFVALTSAFLPVVVASHFGASGAANGFVPRSSYVGFMTAIVVLVPCLVALTGPLARHLPASLINLPHRSYWLAPERRQATAAELGRLSLFPACLIAVFLCLVHWQVVQANGSPSNSLAPLPFWVGVACFVIAVVAWVVRLHLRFGRLP